VNVGAGPGDDRLEKHDERHVEVSIRCNKRHKQQQQPHTSINKHTFYGLILSFGGVFVCVCVLVVVADAEGTQQQKVRSLLCKSVGPDLMICIEHVLLGKVSLAFLILFLSFIRFSNWGTWENGEREKERERVI